MNSSLPRLLLGFFACVMLLLSAFLVANPMGSVSVSTDKSTYNLGEHITVIAQASGFANNSNLLVSAWIMYEGGTKWYSYDTTDSNGVASWSDAIAEVNWPLGVYTAELDLMDNENQHYYAARNFSITNSGPNPTGTPRPKNCIPKRNKDGQLPAPYCEALPVAS